MITILEYKKRFFNLLESQSGNVKPLINEKVQCGNVVPLAKSSNNLTITSDGNGGVIVGGKKLFSAGSDEIVGEEVEDLNQIKNEEGFKPGDYVLNMANRWGWLVNKTNGSWNGYIIKSDEIYGPQTRCAYYIHEKEFDTVKIKKVLKSGLELESSSNWGTSGRLVWDKKEINENSGW